MRIFLSSQTIITQKCILVSYFTENRKKGKVTELSQSVAERAKASELTNQQWLEKQRTLFCSSPRSDNSWGSWVSHTSDRDLGQPCMFCVNMQFSSHTACYTRRQHTSGTRHISAPYYDPLWYSMVHSPLCLLINPFFKEEKLFYGKIQCKIFYGTPNMKKS